MPKPKSSQGLAIHYFKKIDLFGAPIAQFNLDGDDRVKSFVGALLTMVIVSVTFMFAALKMRHLIERHNPNITTVVTSNYHLHFHIHLTSYFCLFIDMDTSSFYFHLKVYSGVDI